MIDLIEIDNFGKELIDEKCKSYEPKMLKLFFLMYADARETALGWCKLPRTNVYCVWHIVQWFNGRRCIVLYMVFSVRGMV